MNNNKTSRDCVIPIRLFCTQAGGKPDEVNYLRWNPLEKGADYFAPLTKE